MLGRNGSTLSLGVLTVAVGYAVIAHGADGPFDSSVALVFLGLASIIGALTAFGQGETRDPILVCAFSFLGYVAFQLAPLPLAVLRIVSHTRAEIADALAGVMAVPHFASLSIAPPTTWVHLSRVAGYTLIFLLARWITRRSAKNKWAGVVPLIVLGTLEAVWGFAQSSDSATALAGTYFNKNHFAGLLEMVLPFSAMYGVVLLHHGRHRRVLSTTSLFAGCALAAAAIAMFFAITSSSSKGGLLATLGSMFLMAVVGIGGRLSGWKRWAVLVGLAVLVLAIFVFVTPTSLVEQFAVVTTDDPTEGRVPIWRDAARLIAAYPLFGVGLGNFYPGLLRYQTVGLGFAWTTAHNDYLQLLAELGAVGFLLVAILMSGVFVRAARAALCAATFETRALGLACVGGLTALLIHSFSEFNTYVLANAMVLSWIAGVSAGLAPSVTQPAEALHDETLHDGGHGEHGRDGGSIPSRATSLLRLAVISLACLLVVNSVGWLVFLQRFQGNPAAERAFCRFGICDTNAALSALQRFHGGDEAAIVPVDDLREFLNRDPAAPYRWVDLGDALRRSGSTDSARYAFARAVALAPNSPPTLLRAASFHFDVGENRRALDLTARSLQAGPHFDQGVFTDFELRRIPVDDVLRYAVLERRSSQAYLHHLLMGDRLADADTAWSSVISRGQADDKLANEYVEFLFVHKKAEAAADEWARYAAARSPEYPDSNRIFNGHFEFDPAGSRFDWRIDTSRGAAIDFDGEVRHSGQRSLRTQFDGTRNLGELGVEQTVFLTPGRYRFRAYMRTQKTSTDQGVHFRVVYDDNPKDLDVSTDDLRGSNDWTPAERVFDAPPGGGLVRLMLTRKPSLKFDSLIRGTVWVDDVSLTKVE